MADADEDGKNIASLLISFFVKTMPEMVRLGYIYLALPPLYGVTINDVFIPIGDEATKDEYLAKGHKVIRFKD
jgi:topoisomerase-4 subunit B